MGYGEDGREGVDARLTLRWVGARTDEEEKCDVIESCRKALNLGVGSERDSRVQIGAVAHQIEGSRPYLPLLFDLLHERRYYKQS